VIPGDPDDPSLSVLVGGNRVRLPQPLGREIERRLFLTTWTDSRLFGVRKATTLAARTMQAPTRSARW